MRKINKLKDLLIDYDHPNDWQYQQWKKSLPDNLRNTDDSYDLYGAFKAGMQPELNEDGSYHLGSRDPKTGRILKRKNHSTYNKAIKADIKAGYYPIEYNEETYTRAPIPMGDLSGWQIPEYQNGGETTLEVTLPEIEVYGDQLRRDIQRTGLTYDELTNLNYGAQRQSQIQSRQKLPETEINPLTGNPATRHGDFLYDNVTGQRVASSKPLEIVSPEFDTLTSLAGIRLVKNLIKPNRSIVNGIINSDNQQQFVDNLSDEEIRQQLARILPNYVIPNSPKKLSRVFAQSRLRAKGAETFFPLDKDLTDVWNIGRSGFTKQTYKEIVGNSKGKEKTLRQLQALIGIPILRAKAMTDASPYMTLGDKIFKNQTGYKLYKLRKQLQNKPYFTYSDDDIDNIIFHEWQHVLDSQNENRLLELLNENVDIPGFDIELIAKKRTKKSKQAKVQNYFWNRYGTELAARGAQLKNYFGLIGNQKLTPEMLEYAKRFYVKDTGMNNNMQDFFDGITDYKLFTDWLNEAAYSKGGIHIKKKNRGKFTETMKRTGKTAEELKHSKNPLTRKRAKKK